MNVLTRNPPFGAHFALIWNGFNGAFLSWFGADFERKSVINANI